MCLSISINLSSLYCARTRYTFIFLLFTPLFSPSPFFWVQLYMWVVVFSLFSCHSFATCFNIQDLGFAQICVLFPLLSCSGSLFFVVLEGWRRKIMAGGGGAAKAEEPQPHPPKDQLPNISYCITSPPPWRKSFFSIFLCSVHLD